MLGSCSVPLDDSTQLICNDVENLGLSVPSVHGEKGDFTIFNMMGSEIGKVKLGFRLLSLGVGLMPHIPDNAVVKFKEKTISLDESREASKARDTANMVLHDIQAADKPVQVDIFTPGPTVEQIMQTENEQLQTTATQTSKEKRRKKKFGHKSSDLVDDIFVTNTVCPPPLYYNSEAEPKKPMKSGLTFADGIFQYNPASNTQEYFVNGATAVGEGFPRYNDAFQEDYEDEYSEYSDSTIRHEDRFSDSDIEEVVDFGSSKITSQQKLTRKTLLKSTPEESRTQLVSRAKSFQNQNVLYNVTQFPLINALLSEIVNLQGMGPQVSQIITPDTASQVQQKSQRIRSAWEGLGSPKSARRQETREEFLSRIATPRGEHEHEGDPGYHKGKRSCASPQKVVPRNKSWLRKEPEKMQTVQGVKKTKLFYGMTNTQRLRLAKGNPELLKALEKEEELRLGEKKKKQQAVKSRPLEKPSTKQRMKVGAEAVSGSKYIQLESSSRDTMESPKQHKRPVPTPRLSLTGDKKDQNTKEYFAAEKERLIRQMAQLSHKPSEGSESSAHSYYTAEPQQSDRSEKSIDVYLPSVDEPALDAHSEDALSVDGSDFGEGAKHALGQTKTLSGPGFPRESVDSRLSMVSSYSAIYSDDFEEEKYGNSYDEPALRKVVEQYSESSTASGHEPSLRKVVEQYSDEGNEPLLRKIVDKYSDDDTLNGKEPSLRRVIDQNSEDNASNKTDTKSNGSYHSVRSVKSKSSTPEVIPQSDIKIKDLPMPNPTSSLRSPLPHNKLPSSVSTRRAIAASTPSVEEESESDPESSTARIPRSQMPSQSFETGTSLDSTGEAAWKRRRQPRPSPRRSLERIRTESVSSYNPSDPENLSPVSPGDPEDLFSETFEDNSKSEKESKYKYIKVPATAKRLGYTWT